MGASSKGFGRNLVGGLDEGAKRGLEGSSRNGARGNERGSAGGDSSGEVGGGGGGNRKLGSGGGSAFWGLIFQGIADGVARTDEARGGGNDFGG